MKIKLIPLLCLFILLGITPLSAQLHYKVYNLPNGTKTDSLKFGDETYTPICIPYNKFAVESWEGGLNFWVPWPTQNYGNYKLYINKLGKVSIGKKGPEGINDPVLNVAGDIRASGNFYLITKNNINNLNANRNTSYLYNKLINLSGKSYTKRTYKQLNTNSLIDSCEFTQKYGKIKYETIKNQHEDRNSNQEIGFIAQDTKQIFPEIVTEDSEGYLSIKYMDLIPIILESLKYQKERISIIEQNISQVESNNHKKGIIELQISKDNTMLKIDYEKKVNDPCLLVIYDMKGVKVESIPLEDKKNIFRINTYDFKDNIYIYTVFYKGEKIINGLIKI